MSPFVFKIQDFWMFLEHNKITVVLSVKKMKRHKKHKNMYKRIKKY